jgi:hypothetical protein
MERSFSNDTAKNKVRAGSRGLDETIGSHLGPVKPLMERNTSGRHHLNNFSDALGSAESIAPIGRMSHRRACRGTLQLELIRVRSAGALERQLLCLVISGGLIDPAGFRTGLARSAHAYQDGYKYQTGFD